MKHRPKSLDGLPAITKCSLVAADIMHDAYEAKDFINAKVKTLMHPESTQEANLFIEKLEDIQTAIKEVREKIEEISK